jgi:hypothetical protein
MLSDQLRNSKPPLVESAMEIEGFEGYTERSGAGKENDPSLCI